MTRINHNAENAEKDDENFQHFKVKEKQLSWLI